MVKILVASCYAIKQHANNVYKMARISKLDHIIGLPLSHKEPQKPSMSYIGQMIFRKICSRHALPLDGIHITKLLTFLF